MVQTSIQTFAASEAKNNLGKVLEAARLRPVAIQQKGKNVALIISPADIEKVEDFFLGMRAMEVIAERFTPPIFLRQIVLGLLPFL